MSEHGDLIRRVRENKGLTQRQLAQAIDTTDSHIARIENGYQRGSFDILSKIANFLKLPEAPLLKQAGFKFPGNTKKPQFGPETYEFDSLSPEVKKALLELVPGIQKVVES